MTTRVALKKFLGKSSIYDGGRYQITGNVTELGAPGAYRVVLFERVSKLPVRSTFSDTAGDYSFLHIKYRANGYFIIAFDHGNNMLNAAIADLITPVLMT